MKFSNTLIVFLGLTLSEDFAFGSSLSHANESDSIIEDIENELSVIEKTICGNIDLVNARCFKDSHPNIYRKSNAIILLRTRKEFTYSKCSGWLAGPNNYVITNNHCINSQEEADGTTFFFNYESHGNNCEKNGQHDYHDAQADLTITGARMVYTNKDWDLTILKIIEGDPVSSFGYLDISDTRPEVGTSIFIPQHPGGRDKSIGLWDSYYNSHMDDNYCKIKDYIPHKYKPNAEKVRYTCDTEGSSSGTAVISLDTYEVVALHNSGGHGCHGNQGLTMPQMYSTITKYIYQTAAPTTSSISNSPSSVPSLSTMPSQQPTATTTEEPTTTLPTIMTTTTTKIPSSYENCNTICDDKRTNHMQRIGVECKDYYDSSLLIKNNRCNLNENWKINKFCQYSCYKAGLAYDDDVICCVTKMNE